MRYVGGHVESADRTNELLLGKNPPPGFAEQFFARVQAVSLGYAREVVATPRMRTALGAQVIFSAAPSTLQPVYGSHPAGVILFLRVRPAGNH